MVKLLQTGVRLFKLTSVAVHTLLLWIAAFWLLKVNSILPEPYLVSRLHPFYGKTDRLMVSL